MNKLKKFLSENKVLLFLAIILVIWLVVFAIIIIVFFYGSSKDTYGNRLDGIKDLPITDNLKNDITTTLKDSSDIKDVIINVKGTIIYINIECNDGTSNDSAKEGAEGIISLFSESLLKAYDIQFIVKINSNDKGDGYVLMGTQNYNGSGGVIWKEYALQEESSAE